MVNPMKLCGRGSSDLIEFCAQHGLFGSIETRFNFVESKSSVEQRASHATYKSTSELRRLLSLC